MLSYVTSICYHWYYSQKGVTDMKKSLAFVFSLLVSVAVIASYLNVAVIGEVRSLNPYFVSSSAERQLIGYLYETLLTTQGGMTVGAIAESWEVSIPERSMTVTIKDRLFHDGNPLTAEDVAFSFNMTVEKRLPMGPLLAWFARAEVIDEHTVKLNFRVLNSSVIDMIPVAIPIIPRALWEDVERPMEFSNLENPVGTGAFKFNRSTPQTVTFDAFKHHSDSPENISGIVFHLVQDQTMGFLGLVRGDYDYIAWDLDPVLATQIVQAPSRYPDMNVAITEGIKVTSVMFNHRREPMNDLSFRKAIQHAINYPEIIERVYQGYASEASIGMIPLTAEYVYDESLGAPAMDVDLARHYLEQSGYDGRKLRILVYSTKEQMEVAEYLKLYLGRIGIGIEVDVLGHEAVTSRLQSADFDMAITGYTIGAHPSMLFYHMHTSRGEIEDGRVSGYNYGGISIPEIDAVLNRIWMSFEEAALKQAFVDLQSMIAEFVPAVPICVPNKVEAYSTKRFTNWQISDADGVFTSETLRVLQPK